VPSLVVFVFVFVEKGQHFFNIKKNYYYEHDSVALIPACGREDCEFEDDLDT
jgi:hypothetical protein